MSFVVAYALAGAGTLLVVLWVMLYLRYSSQYDAMIAAIDKKQFFLPEIFFIGFGFMDMFKVNLKTEAGRKKEKKIAEIYGEKYAEYYHNCIVGPPCSATEAVRYSSHLRIPHAAVLSFAYGITPTLYRLCGLFPLGQKAQQNAPQLLPLRRASGDAQPDAGVDNSHDDAPQQQ